MAVETRHRKRRVRVLVVTAGLGMVLAAAPSAWAATESRRPPIDPTARFYQQQPRPVDCKSDNAAARCARITVPVDWAKPQGATAELEVVRLPGTGRGPLVLNPGGPGGSGVEFLLGSGDHLRGLGLEGYDLIGWDPRGVGRSTPLTCPQEATEAIEKVDGSPDTPAEAALFEQVATKWAQDCRKASGPIFDHMDTGSTARDLDVVRAVVSHGDKLNYLGFSYGTIIGGRYAELFPARVGRMILDSAGHPDQTYQSWMSGVAEAKDLALSDYLAGCAGRPACPFASMPAKAARGWIQQLVRDTDRRPLHSGPKTVSQAQLVAVLTAGVGSAKSWPKLDDILAGLHRGDASTLADAAPPTTVDIENISTTCQDISDHRNPMQVLHDAARTAQIAPVFAVELTAGSPCTRWPAPVPVPPHKLHARGAPPILVVGITHDTAAPYRWNQELVDQLGNARLLTFDGSGHGAYLRNKCSRDAENAFLATGTLPAPGTVCPTD